MTTSFVVGDPVNEAQAEGLPIGTIIRTIDYQDRPYEPYIRKGGGWYSGNWHLELPNGRYLILFLPLVPLVVLAVGHVWDKGPTIQELDSLPVGAVLADDEWDTVRKLGHGDSYRWRASGVATPLSAEDAVDFLIAPVTILGYETRK